MADNNTLKEINIKDYTYCYSGNIVSFNNFGFQNIVSYNKSFQNIWFYHFEYTTSYNIKPLFIIFDKINEYTKDYDRTKYLTLIPGDENMKECLISWKVIFQMFVLINT